MKTLYIKDKITTNTNITNDGYVTYLALLCLLRKDIKQYYINANLLGYTLYNKYPVDRPVYDSLNNGILNLADEHIINTIPDLDKSKRKHECLADLSTIYDRNGFYTNVDIADVRLIVSNVDQYANAISIARFYIYVLSTLHKKKDDELLGIGFTSIDKMSKEIGLNEKTIYSYINKLELLELIYVHKPTISIVKQEGCINEIPATYGRFKDNERISEAGAIYENKYQNKISRSNKNNLRSLAQKYYVMENYIKQGIKIPYDEDEIEKIYLAAKELNKKYEENSRTGRYKSLDIFKKYSFYEE